MPKRPLLVALFSISSFLVNAAPALAVGTVDQEQLDTSLGYVFSAFPSVGQTFTAGMSGTLDSVAVFPDWSDGINGYTLEVRTVSEGLPTTTVIASQTISYLPIEGTWATITFSEPAAIVAGAQYAIVVASPDQYPKIELYGGPNHSNPYATGSAMAKAAYGWVPEDFDFGFITYVTPASYQPDGWIRKGSRRFIGNDVYNADASQQTRVAAPQIGVRVLFRVAIQNDGTVPDSFTVQAAGSEAYYSIRYYRHSKEITTAVLHGTFTTPVIAPGDRYVIKVWVKAMSLATSSSVTRVVTLASVNDPTRVDAVQFVVQPHY